MNEEHRQEQQPVDIYALVDAYKDLLDTKEELKELTTENNKAIMEARDALAKAMIDAESPRISRGGFMYSLGEKNGIQQAWLRRRTVLRVLERERPGRHYKADR